MPEYLTFRDLCGITSISRRTLARWLKTGELPVDKIQLGPRSIRFRKDQVLNWLRDRGHKVA